MRADLIDQNTNQVAERNVYVPNTDAIDHWNDDLREQGSRFRYVFNSNNPPHDCRCDASELHECVCQIS